MSEENDQPGEKKERRFSQEQYDMLIRCSEKRDMTEWNTWRRENMSEEILLEGADLEETHLKGADLREAQLKGAKLYKTHLEGADLEDAHLESAILGQAYLEGAGFEAAHLEGADLTMTYLEGADLADAHLEGAHLYRAHLEGARLYKAHLEGADLAEAHLKGASLIKAHLENAHLMEAHLENAHLMEAHLEDAHLMEAHLEGADLEDAHLKGADFLEANLKGAILKYADLKRTNFRRAVVDGSTVVWQCKVSRHTKNTKKEWGTDFSGVGINQIRINPETKQLLEYNIRRMNWQEWYKGKSRNRCIRWIRLLLTSPIRLFWWTSNYGLSTLRVILTFFVLAFVFAGVYWLCPACIMVNGHIGDLRDLLHAVYFSVVTMTTLGFGDIAANPDSWLGQLLLMLQVLLGYVLLAALVTRFAVLFTAGGPAGKFSKQPKKPTEEPPEKPTKNPPN